MFKKHTNCYFFEDTMTTGRDLYLSCFSAHLLAETLHGSRVWTYAFGPSCFMIFTAQSSVLLYLWASRPCQRGHTGQEPWQQAEPGRPRHNTHLHSGLDDVEGGVPEHAGGTSDGSERTGYHGVDGFVGVVPLVIHKEKSFWSFSLGQECVIAGWHTPLYQFLSTVMT